MSFDRLYRLSFYGMLFLATLALNIDSSDDFPPAMLYPLAVLCAATIAFLTVDRNPRQGLSRELANLLALGSGLPSLIECWHDNDLLILALGHWLVVLMLIKMFLPKTTEDDWYLVLLALTQVIVGAFLPGERIGLVIILWAISSLWVLGLFYLKREAGKPVGGGAAQVVVTPLPSEKEPYPGLVNPAFVISAIKMAALTIALGGLIFLLVPRRTTQLRANQIGSAVNPLTGFSDVVELGRMGEILESDEVVMTVELYDLDGVRTQLDQEPHWRGVTLDVYDEGRWSRRDPTGTVVRRSSSSEDAASLRKDGLIRQRIRQEQTNGNTLFGLRPIIDTNGRQILFNQYDGTIFRQDAPENPSFLTPFRQTPIFTYEVISQANPDATQPGETYPTATMITEELLYVPDGMREILDRIVRTALGDNGQGNPTQRARLIESYLRDSGQFSYTLSQDQVDRSLDPVADFLLNRKEGHCEYFASALALLLRSNGIPARLVNGFKGGDWNELGHVLYVRQKHAHSWVEALVGQSARGDRPLWVTLDPTPGLERQQVIDELGGLRARFRGTSDFLRYIWVFYVVGFDSDRQDKYIYQPLREQASRAKRGFIRMAEMARSALAWMLDFPSAASFFSARGFVATVVTLLLAALGFRLTRPIRRWLWRLMGRSPTVESARMPGMLLYRRLVQMLSPLGLVRPPAETHREFADRAHTRLAERVDLKPPLATIPTAVVDAFYRIRFGGRMLSEEEVKALETQLDELETSLHVPRRS